MNQFKIINRLAVLLTFLVVFCSACYAIQESDYEFTIVNNKVHVQNTIQFTQPYSGILQISLPKDAEAVSLYIGGKPEAYEKKIRVTNASQVMMNYLTQQFLDKQNFLVSLKPGYNATMLRVKLILPEGASLKTPITEGVTGGSAYPTPDSVTTDGQSIILNWEKENFRSDEDLSIFVMMEDEFDYTYVIVTSVFALLSLTVIALLIMITRGTKNPKHDGRNDAGPKDSKIDSKIEKPQSRDNDKDVLEYLKEDEKQVIRVLKLKEGSCEQGTLRVATNFSKAKLSRILMELAERKFVYKEQKGKKNLIFLK